MTNRLGHRQTDGGWAMPSARSGLLRTEPSFTSRPFGSLPLSQRMG
jgi:hypothetical protein